MDSLGFYLSSCPSCGTRGQLSLSLELYVVGAPLSATGYSIEQARYVTSDIQSIRCAECHWVGTGEEIWEPYLVKGLKGDR